MYLYPHIIVILKLIFGIFPINFKSFNKIYTILSNGKILLKIKCINKQKKKTLKSWYLRLITIFRNVLFFFSSLSGLQAPKTRKLFLNQDSLHYLHLTNHKIWTFKNVKIFINLPFLYSLTLLQSIPLSPLSTINTTLFNQSVFLFL